MKCKHQMRKESGVMVCVNPYTGGQYPCEFVGTEELCGFAENTSE